MYGSSHWYTKGGIRETCRPACLLLPIKSQQMYLILSDINF